MCIYRVHAVSLTNKSHDNINSGVNQLLVNFVYNQMMEKKDDLQVKYVKVCVQLFQKKVQTD